MRSLMSLGAAQSSRILTLPSQTVAAAPGREIALEGFRQRNALLDYLFYDLRCISPEEAKALAPSYAAEGAILSVGPSSDPSLDIYRDIASFMGAEMPTHAAIAVAGVGSSALGAAAFARNVADAIDAPVLAVVSGYGLSDLMTEAVGGFFMFGYLNSVRHLFEPLDDAMRPYRSTAASLGVETSSESTSDGIADLIRKSLDVKTLVGLLGEAKPKLLIGHSKGNLVISEALYAMRDAQPELLDELSAACRIVTMSARVAMPPNFEDVVDVIGQVDAFGEINSRRRIATDVKVPWAWHHTNTEIPMHLPVTKTLRDVLDKI